MFTKVYWSKFYLNLTGNITFNCLLDKKLFDQLIIVE